MKEKKVNKNITRLVVFSIFIVFLTTSANSAFTGQRSIPSEGNDPPIVPLGDNYYEWRDDFNDEQKIDMTKSWGYVVTGGVAKMKNTFEVWTEEEWTKLRPFTLTNNGGSQTDIAVNIIVEKDGDMKSDYGDVRFKHGDNPGFFLDYWREDYDSNEASFWVKIPSLSSGSNQMYLFYGNSGASYDGDFSDVFTDWGEVYANDKKITYRGDKEGGWDPDVCYGNNQFLVAWEEGDPYWVQIGNLGFKQEIRGSIFSPSGGDPVVFDKRIFSDVDNGWTYFHNEDPSIAYGGSGKWAVTWEHWDPTNSPFNPQPITTMDIYARTVQKSGSDFSLGSQKTICSASNCQADPHITYDNVNSKYMVVWEDARSTTMDYDIYARLFDSNLNTAGSEKVIDTDPDTQTEPWAAYDPENEQYFIVWEDGIHPENGPFRIRGGLFDESLNTMAKFTIAEPNNWPNSNEDYFFPCIQYNEDSERYLVTWNTGDLSDTPKDWHGDIMGKIYDNSGNEEVSEFTIKSGEYVRTDIVPYLSEAFFVSFDNDNKIYGRLVSSEGDLLSETIQLSTYPSAKADWANLATDGSKIFSVWEDERDVTYDILPDAFGNMKYLNVPDGSQISVTWGQEQEQILSAQITSDPIEPDNLDYWHMFGVAAGGTVTFDILDGDTLAVLISDASDGEDLEAINPNTHDTLRLQAHFTRTNPSYSPTINWWQVQYGGIDEVPPVTEFDHIDGTKGDKYEGIQWYITECITVFVNAYDLPSDTGSGIDETYYTIDGGETCIYSEESGIHICAVDPDWYGDWEVNFWSVDKNGNVENKNKPENFVTVYIDCVEPTIKINYPGEDANVNVPFEVSVDVQENAGLRYVDFDIEPFDSPKRPNLPYIDDTPPYTWTCNEQPIDDARPRTVGGDLQPLGRSVQYRVRAYDYAGQDDIKEVFITIDNWPDENARSVVVIQNFRELFALMKLGFARDKELNIGASTPQNADTAKFVATNIITKRQTTVIDDDFSDGVTATFDIPTGFYKVTYSYSLNGNVISSSLLARIIFINR